MSPAAQNRSPRGPTLASTRVSAPVAAREHAARKDRVTNSNSRLLSSPQSGGGPLGPTPFVGWIGGCALSLCPPGRGNRHSSPEATRRA